MKKLHCVRLLLYSNSEMARDLLKRLIETSLKGVSWMEDVQHPALGANELELWLAVKTINVPHTLARKIFTILGDIEIGIDINGEHFPKYHPLTGDHYKHCCRHGTCQNEGGMCCLKGHVCV